MGTQRSRRVAFFKSHPLCCFCGGASAATTEDHIPARTLFREKQWPEGYVFPACHDCNHGSSLDELVLGWIVRIQVSDYTANDESELEDALTKLNRRRPEWVAKMRELSRIETRRHLREHQLSAASFPGGEVYVMTMPDEITSALDRYAIKLGKALYYLHTGRIIPTSGLIKATALTNSQFTSPGFPLRSFDILAIAPPMSRAKRDLSDQFAYRYAVPIEGGGAGFLVQFRESTAMLILAFEDRQKYEQGQLTRGTSSVGTA